MARRTGALEALHELLAAVAEVAAEVAVRPAAAT
jgi:hypothetical protein